MLIVKSFLLAQLSKPFLYSPLQMAVAGIILYFISMYFGPNYACGAGNVDLNRGIFNCFTGAMAWSFKGLIVAGMALASLCLGRAVSLLENGVRQSK